MGAELEIVSFPSYLAHSGLDFLFSFVVAFLRDCSSTLSDRCLLTGLASAIFKRKILRANSVSQIKTSLLHEASLGLFNGGSVENFICLNIIGEHLLKLVVDLLVQV